VHLGLVAPSRPDRTFIGVVRGCVGVKHCLFADW
jgi:hypothetical protein